MGPPSLVSIFGSSIPITALTGYSLILPSKTMGIYQNPSYHPLPYTLDKRSSDFCILVQNAPQLCTPIFIPTLGRVLCHVLVTHAISTSSHISSVVCNRRQPIIAVLEDVMRPLRSHSFCNLIKYV